MEATRAEPAGGRGLTTADPASAHTGQRPPVNADACSRNIWNDMFEVLLSPVAFVSCAASRGVQPVPIAARESHPATSSSNPLQRIL